MQQIFIFKKLEPENVWHFCLKYDIKSEQIIEMVSDPFSFCWLIDLMTLEALESLFCNHLNQYKLPKGHLLHLSWSGFIVLFFFCFEFQLHLLTKDLDMKGSLKQQLSEPWGETEEGGEKMEKQKEGGRMREGGGKEGGRRRLAFKQSNTGNSVKFTSAVWITSTLQFPATQQQMWRQAAASAVKSPCRLTRHVSSLLSDINECEDISDKVPLCQNGQCTNTEGSYKCTCLPGFVASAKPHKCIPAIPESELEKTENWDSDFSCSSSEIALQPPPPSLCPSPPPRAWH